MKSENNTASANVLLFPAAGHGLPCLAIRERWLTFTAFPVSEELVSTGAGAAVRARNVDTGMHAQTRGSLQLVNLTLIYICRGNTLSHTTQTLKKRVHPSKEFLLTIILLFARTRAPGNSSKLLVSSQEWPGVDHHGEPSETAKAQCYQAKIFLCLVVCGMKSDSPLLWGRLA